MRKEVGAQADPGARPEPRAVTRVAALLPAGARAWAVPAAIALLVGLAYFLAAWLGLALRVEGLAVFWPAAGVAAGAMIVLEGKGRLWAALGTATATLLANLAYGNGLAASAAFAALNTAEPVIVALLLEARFAPPFRLDRLGAIAGLVAAAATGAALAGLGCALLLPALGQSQAPPLDLWRAWLMADLTGIVTVAPTLLGLGYEAERKLPAWRRAERALALAALAAAAAYTLGYRAGTGPWPTVVPLAVMFPLLLWIAARCQPSFAAAGSLVVALAVVWHTAQGLGRFADPAYPLPDRILAAQVYMLSAGLCALTLSALIETRRRAEAALAERNARLEELAQAVDLAHCIVREPGGRILRWSAGLERLYGWRAEEAVGRLAHELLATEFPAPRAAIEAALLARGEWEGELRQRRRDGSPLTVASHWALHRGRDGRPAVVIEVDNDISGLKAAESALRESEERFRLAAAAMPGVVYDWDIRAGRVVRSEGIERLIGLRAEDCPADPGWWRTRVHPDDLARIEPEWGALLAAGASQLGFEYRVRHEDGSWRHVWDRSFVARDAAGRPIRIVGSTIDITEREAAKGRQRLLMAELNHRVKNSLAVVQAIARQTLGGGPEVEIFLGRLRSLAITQDLLTGTSWQGADLAALLREELGAHAGEGRARLAGPDVLLAPSLAGALGLILHELATNAAKYGALSVPQGRVEIVWQVAPQPDGAPLLDLTWRETGGPPVAPPSRRGFGSTLIERSLPKGRVHLDFAPEGLVCRIELPLA